MTDLLAIGTRKGLWLARSDDDRRTWTVDGPHLLAQEVAAVSIDTRGADAAGAGRHPVRPLGPDGHVVRRPRARTWQETDHGAIRFPEDTGAALARVWQLRPDTADRPGRRLGRLRAALAVAQHRRRLLLRAGPRAAATTRTARPGSPAAGEARCTPCCPTRRRTG